MASSVIGALRVNLGIDTAAFSQGLQTAGSKLSGFGAVFRKAIVPIAAIGATAAAGLGVAVKASIDAADEISKAAAKFGIPTEELSRLKYAADLSDVSLETLGTSVGRLSRLMSDAAGGSKSAVDTFSGLGIAFQNADGSLRSSTDVLRDIADLFEGMPDGAAKTAAAMDLMGRGGAQMIPLLNGGSAALAEMAAEADKFGQVFSAESGQQAEQFNDNLTRLGGAIQNLGADLTVKVLPYLTQFTDWLVANGPTIANFVGFLVDLGAATVHAAATVIDLGVQISSAFGEKLTQAAAAVQRFASDLSAGLDQARQFVSAKMAEIASAFHGIVEQMRQVGRDLIDGLIAGIKERVTSAIDAVKGVGSSIISAAKTALGVHSPSTVFAEIGRNVMQGLSQGVTSMMSGVQSEVSGFGQGLASTFADVLTGATDWRDAMRGILADVGAGLLQTGLGDLGGALGKFIGIPGYAGGTNYAPGGPALVGERGPEVVDLPRGSRVTPNHKLGGGQVDVRLYMDRDGNWQAAVERISGGVTARGMAIVRKDVPKIMSETQRRVGR